MSEKKDKFEQLIATKLEQVPPEVVRSQLITQFRQHNRKPLRWLVPAMALSISFLVVFSIVNVQQKNSRVDPSVTFLVENKELLENMELLALVDSVDYSEQEWEVLVGQVDN